MKKKIIILIVALVMIILGVFIFGITYKDRIHANGKVYIKDSSYRTGAVMCQAMIPECGVCVVSDNIDIKGIVRDGSCYLPIK